ncbi:MAG: response regulator transcription factor [Ignavibacteriaceae bacterium]
MPIAVAIVEDNEDTRLGITYILKSSNAFEVVGSFNNAEDLINKFKSIRPDVILMDIDLPGVSGIEATAILKKEHPNVQIAMLSVFKDDENVFNAICAGACGYISKPILPAQIIDIVEQAFAGASPMSPNIARRVLEMFKQYAPPKKEDYNLTPREMEVLDLLVQGLDNKMIAEKLFLSTFTIRAHIRNIYDKLHVHSKSQAISKALRERVLNYK